MTNFVIYSASYGLSLSVETARNVCAYFFGYDTLPPEQRLEKETARGYKSRCVRLLNKLCSVSERSIRRWGRGLDFDNMPPIRQAQLTILMLRDRLQKAESQIQQKDEQIKKMRRAIDHLRWQLDEARRVA
jgi:hypothetical protein